MTATVTLQAIMSARGGAVPDEVQEQGQEGKESCADRMNWQVGVLMKTTTFTIPQWPLVEIE